MGDSGRICLRTSCRDRRELTDASTVSQPSIACLLLLLVNLVLVVRLPQVGAAQLCSQLPLLASPPRDRAVVAAEQDIRHAHPAELTRARVLRVLEQAFGERLVGCAFFGADRA